MRLSNAFYLLLIAGCSAVLAVYLYINRGSTGIGLIFLPFGVIILLIPLAITVSLFVSRLVSERTIGSILRGSSYPDVKEYSTARAFLAQHKFEEAIEEFRKLLEEHPKDDYSREQIAETYADKIKDYQKAAEEYRKLLEMQIDENRAVNALNRLADIYGDHLDNPSMAADSLREIIRRHPDSPNAKRAEIRLKAMGRQASV